MKAKPYSSKNKRELSPKNEIGWVDNPNPEIPSVIDFRVPEFSHLCPITGQPDVAVMHVRFVPNTKLLETRAFMQYLWVYRDKEMFHEAIVPVILNDIARVIEPKWLQVMGEFMVRGTSWERIVSSHTGEGFDDVRVRNLAKQYRFRL